MPRFAKVVIWVVLSVCIATGVYLALNAENSVPVVQSVSENANMISSQETPEDLPENITLDAEKIRISEFMIKNRCTLPDEDGDFSDWIEIENISSSDVELEAWTLADNENDEGWSFPETVLAPGERIVVFASGKDKVSGELHTDFSLSLGEDLCLRNKYGYLCTKLPCSDDSADASFCICEDGSAVRSLYPTPGYENTAAGYELWQSSLAPLGPLVINEAVVANFTSNYRLGPVSCDWAEIKNISSEPQQLSDFYLSDDDDDYRLWRFPEMTLAPGEIIVVLCDDVQQPTSRQVLWANFSLDSSSEELYLSDSTGKLVDYAALRDIPYKCSYGRMEGENGWFYFPDPSALSENSGGCRRVSEMPVSLTKDGVFNGVEAVTAELSSAGNIYYTTDGSLPTEKSTPYTGPVSFDRTTVLRAISVEDGALPSRPLSLSFIINENHSLPVLSLVSDSPGEFSMMYNNGNKLLELPGSISLYEEDSTFTIGCGISMNGATSLHLPKKNISVRFRGAYGQSELDYDVFDGGITEFTNLTIRSGQDYYSAIIRDVLSEDLCLELSDSVVTQRSKFCILYVNGEYRGIYALKDKSNEQLYASLAGVSKESVSLIKAPVYSGTPLYKDVIGFALSNDMSDPDNYSAICRYLDVDSLIDWIIMEGYTCNSDLWLGNVSFCMSDENDGRWRLVFYDLDCSFLSQNENFSNLLSNYSGYSKQIAALACALMHSDEFKDKFLKRAAEAFGTVLTTENVLKKIDELASQIEPEVERDYVRYGRTKAQWQYNINYLRSFVGETDLTKLSIDNICSLLKLDEQQKDAYFGSLLSEADGGNNE